MKLVRLLIVLLFSSLLLLILAAVLAWPFLRVDERLRLVFIKQIARSLNSQAELQHVHLGWGRLHLLNLEVADVKGRWGVAVSDASIVFNPFKLFIYGFNANGLLATISEVSIERPIVSLRLSPPDSVKTAEDSSRFNGWKILDNLPAELLISKVKLKDGVLHLHDPTGNPLFTLGGLDLDLYSPHPGMFQGRISSATLGARTLQSSLDLTLNRRARTLEANFYASLDQLHLGKEVGLADSLNLRLNDLDLKLRLWALEEKTGLDGEISLSSLTLGGLTREWIKTDPLRLVIGDWKLLIPAFTAHGLTADWKFSGAIPDLRSPTLNLLAEAHSDDCSKLAQLLPKNSVVSPSGRLNFSMGIRGEISNPLITVQADLENLSSSVTTLHDLKLSGDFEDKRIIINSFEAHSPQSALNLTGQIQLDGVRSNAEAQIRWEGSFPGLPNSKQGVLEGALYGEHGEFRLNAYWKAVNASTLEIQGFYSYALDSLNVKIDLAESTSRIFCTATALTDHPVFHLHLEEPQRIVQQLVKWDHWDKVNDISFSGDFSGPLDQLSCHVQTRQIKAASNIVFNGQLGIKSASWVDFNGDISMQRGIGAPLDGRITATWKDSVLSLQSLQLDDAIFASGSYNTVTNEIGTSELRISNWPLSRGMEIFFPQVAARWGANLDARLEVYGPAQHPLVSFNLYASRGFFLDQGDFWAVLAAELQNDTLRVDECNVGRGAISLVKASGIADLANSEIKFRVQSHLVEIANVFELFGGNPAKISGPFKLDAEVTGSFKKPELSLLVGMVYGSIYHIPFDSLSATMRFDLLTDQALVLSDFRLRQKPDLTLEVQGVLPFNKHPLDLQLLFKGNILKILHQIEPSIPVTKGDGELLLELEQVNEKLVLSGVNLELQNGYLKLPEVVNEIQSLNVKIKLQDNKLYIENVSGEIEGQRFRLRNSFDDQIYGNLEHLYFSDLNLDAGIMILETFGRGLHVHIPSLMPNGTKGYLNLKGKEGHPYFTASGPVQRPFFQGVFNVSGATVTFPFLAGDGKPPSKFVRGVLSVLTSARWDVQILPARDNRYVKEIKPVENKTLLGDVSDLIASVNVDVNMDAADSKLNVVGSMDQGDFAFIGSLVSTRGTVEYLDLNFRVERFETEFDQNDLLPWVEGSASTVYADSMGFTHTIYLRLYVVDHTTGERQERGRWGDFIFILEDDVGSSQEQILAQLGYSPGTVSSKVGALGGTILSGVVLRSFIRPVERQLENILQMDVIRLQPTIAQHLFESQILGIDPEPGGGPQSQIVWGAYFLRQSQLTVGKYLSDDVFLSYNGTWKTGINAANERQYGFLHRWNLDYRIRRISGNLVLTLGYEWDSLERLVDRRVSLRYSFAFR